MATQVWFKGTQIYNTFTLLTLVDWPKGSGSVTATNGTHVWIYAPGDQPAYPAGIGYIWQYDFAQNSWSVLDNTTPEYALKF